MANIDLMNSNCETEIDLMICRTVPLTHLCTPTATQTHTHTHIYIYIYMRSVPIAAGVAATDDDAEPFIAINKQNARATSKARSCCPAQLKDCKGG